MKDDNPDFSEIETLAGIDAGRLHSHIRDTIMEAIYSALGQTPSEAVQRQAATLGATAASEIIDATVRAVHFRGMKYAVCAMGSIQTSGGSALTHTAKIQTVHLPNSNDFLRRNSSEVVVLLEDPQTFYGEQTEARIIPDTGPLFTPPEDTLQDAVKDVLNAPEDDGEDDTSDGDADSEPESTDTEPEDESPEVVTPVDLDGDEPFDPGGEAPQEIDPETGDIIQ